MNLKQQKDAKQVQSFDYVEQSPNKVRPNGTTPIGQLDQRNLQLSRSPLHNDASRNGPLSPKGRNLVQTNVFQRPSSNQHNRLLYSKVYGPQEQGMTVFYNQLSPGQIHRKTIEQLQYQNAVLLQQIQQRDDIIAMYKSGWQPNTLPINDQIIKNLNLQLAQKNVLIEQFHRSLAQFDQTVRRQNIKLSQICVQQFHNLQILIVRHEQYPILITQRFIQTSKHAQKIYIKDTTIIQQYIYKLEQSYKEITILKQKLVWFQKQLGSRDSIILGLKGQLGDIGAYQTQINQYQQHITVYQQQINTLKIQIQQIQSSGASYQSQIIQLQNQINRLLQVIANLQAQLSQHSGASNQNANIKQQLNIYVTEINQYKVQINSYISEINNYKQQLAALQNQFNGAQQGSLTQINQYKNQINVYITEINNYKQQISALQNQINGLRGNQGNQINDLKGQINIYITQINNYKQQITILQNQINSLKGQGNQINDLKGQINIYITEINKYKQQIIVLQQQINQLRENNDGDNLELKQQLNTYISVTQRLKQQIDFYQQQIHQLQNQIQNLKGRLSKPVDCGHAFQISSLKEQINKYKQQINTLNITIQNGQSDNKWEIDSLKKDIERLKQQNSKYKQQNYDLQQQINRLNQEIIKLKGKIDRLESDAGNQAQEWKHKYQESITIIKKLKIQIQQISIQINSGGQWKAKYDSLYSKYLSLQDQIEYYKLQYSKIQQNWSSQEKKLRQDLQAQFLYKIKLLEQKLRIQIRQELQITIRIQITQKLKKQWELKLQQSFENLRQAQQYIKSLLAKIEELELTIQQWTFKYRQLESKPAPVADVSGYESKIQKLQLTIVQWISKYKELQGRPAPVVDVSGYESKIQKLQLTIQQWISKYKELESRPAPVVDVSRYQLTIEQLEQALRKAQQDYEELKYQLYQAQQYIIQLQQQLKNQQNNTQLSQSTISLNITIQQLTIQVKQLLAKINIITNEKEEIVIKYNQLQELFSSTKIQYELTIKRLNDEIAHLKAQLNKKSQGNKDWQKQKKQLIEKYERQLRERWDQLQKAEEYIKNYTKESQEIISYLEIRIKQLQEQLELQGGSALKDEYLYKIDARYQQIRKRLLIITNQTNFSLTTESQYWQSYRARRKQQIQTLQTTINQSLTLMSQIEQAIIIRREQLHRLDFTKIEDILREVQKIKKEKGQLQGAVKQQFESRFYGVLKSVSTVSGVNSIRQ